MNAAMYPRQGWSEHLDRLNWRQGEHVIISGPTSSGKSSLARPLLDKRTHVIALFTKLADRTIATQFKGWRRYERFPKRGIPRDEHRVIIWPKAGATLRETVAIHRYIMREALDRAVLQGNWCVYIDEGLYLADSAFGSLRQEMGMAYYTARSSGVSMVTAVQRPFHVPRVILSSVSHAYIARVYDSTDIKRLGELGGVNTREVGAALIALEDQHDFLYLNPQGTTPPRIVNTRMEKVAA